MVSCNHITIPLKDVLAPEGWHGDGQGVEEIEWGRGQIGQGLEQRGDVLRVGRVAGTLPIFHPSSWPQSLGPDRTVPDQFRPIRIMWGLTPS